ncbi:hypothetical protein [Tuberibacillus sp. Marseille-P3662]|uniref:hypothetical protein n=1 Tax=Tuberibacillus sp. Marseille-P3662 TaxID=1965358 RepID=UPI000A1C9BA4|nr:hypothetical protein [Tuberibacillus sp. Marseille-P3662]
MFIHGVPLKGASYYEVNQNLFLIDHFNGLIGVAGGERTGAWDLIDPVQKTVPPLLTETWVRLVGTFSDDLV